MIFFDDFRRQTGKRTVDARTVHVHLLALLGWRLRKRLLLGEGIPEREHRVGGVDADRLDHGLAGNRALHGRLVLDLHALGQLVVNQLLQRDGIQELDHVG